MISSPQLEGGQDVARGRQFGDQRFYTEVIGLSALLLTHFTCYIVARSSAVVVWTTGSGLGEVTASPSQ